MPQLSGVLLTTADRQIEGFTVGKDPTRSFEDSFYEAVLFHERAVLPDIFAFISTALHKAQESSRTFHLDAAMEAGLVVPAFRRNCSSFEDSLNAISAQGIQGVQKAPWFIAERLDKSLIKSKIKPITGHEDLSRDYANLVMNVLNRMHQQVTISDANSACARVWPITTAFMNSHGIVHLLEENIASTNGELLRGNFYNILLHTLNRLSPSGIEKVHDCFNDLFLHPACKNNPAVQEPIRNLLVVANTAYHLNMSSAFSAGNYTPGRLYAPEALAALDLTVSVSKKLSDVDRATESKPVVTLSVVVNIPSVAQLRTAKWDDLISIRDDLGRGYFAALKNWHRDPEEFEKCLRSYAAALTSRVKVKAPPSRVVLNRFSEAEREGVIGVTKHALAEAAEGTHGNKLLGLVDIGSNIFMSWMYERPVKLSFSHSPDAAIVV